MNIVVALVPVLLLLAALQLMDSFKLVRLPAILAAIGAGAVAAFACLWLHTAIVSIVDIPTTPFARYVAPVTEEAAKSLFIVFLLKRRRIAFLVDAAVFGFAVGTGFALIENIDYLRHLDSPRLSLWLVRGLGTAVLHGATTAIFAIVARTMADRWNTRKILGLFPGLLLAIAIHSAFNHLPLPPLAMTLLLLAVLPLAIMFVFQRSEQATREWIGAGLDIDMELLELMSSEVFAVTRFGSYLQQLRSRFSGVVVADMYCLLRLEIELSIQAKAMLMARERDVEIPVDDDLRTTLREIDYLHESIGRLGQMALTPLHVTSDRDRWHRYLIEQAQ